MKISGLSFGAAKPVAPLQSPVADPNQREAVIKEALAKESLPLPAAPTPAGNVFAHDIRAGSSGVYEPVAMQQAKAEPTVASQLKTIERSVTSLYSVAGELQTRLSPVLAPELANGTEGATEAARPHATRLVSQLGDIDFDLNRLETLLVQLIHRLELE